MTDLAGRMSPTMTPLEPANASTPLTAIRARTPPARRLPPTALWATSIDSAKKTSHAKLSSASATEGHWNDVTSGSEESGSCTSLRARLARAKEDYEAWQKSR